MLKFFLHLAASERAEIAAALVARAVAFGTGQLFKADTARDDLRTELFDNLNGFLFGARDGGLLPRRRAATVTMLDQQMPTTNRCQFGLKNENSMELI